MGRTWPTADRRDVLEGEESPVREKPDRSAASWSGLLRLGTKPAGLWMARLTCAVYVGVLTVLLLASDVESARRWWLLPAGLGGTFIHFAAFVGFGLLVSASRFEIGRWWLLATLATYSVGTELLQFFSPPRTVDWRDAIANLLGAATGLAVGQLVTNPTFTRRDAVRPSEQYRLLTRENLVTYDTFVLADDAPDDLDPDLALVVHELTGRRMTVHRTRLLPAGTVDPARLDHARHSPCPTCGRVEGIVEEEVRCPYDHEGPCGLLQRGQ